MFDQTAILAGFLLLSGVIFNFSLHKLEEGHVGVYFRVSSLPYIFVILSGKFFLSP